MGPSNPQNILDIIEKQARTLLAENLPSTYALISQLFDIITQANQLKITHRIIRAHLNRAGINIPEKKYTLYLYRVRKSRSDPKTVRLHSKALQELIEQKKALELQIQAAQHEPLKQARELIKRHGLAISDLGLKG